MIFKLISLIVGRGISCEISLRRMWVDLTGAKSTLAPSHYLSQSWPRFMSPYGITRPHSIKQNKNTHKHQFTLITTEDLTMDWKISWNILISINKVFNGDLSFMMKQRIGGVNSFILMQWQTPFTFLSHTQANNRIFCQNYVYTIPANPLVPIIPSPRSTGR